MGSGASVPLPEVMDAAFFQQHGVFDENKFRALRGKNNKISRDVVLATNEAGIEREVFLVYMMFCPNGEMNTQSFLRLCLECKLLRKSFNKAAAEILFHQAKFRVGLEEDRVNYPFFRGEVIPDICRVRELSMEDLLKRIGSCDGPSENETRVIKRTIGESLFIATAAVAAETGHVVASAAAVTNVKHDESRAAEETSGDAAGDDAEGGAAIPRTLSDRQKHINQTKEQIEAAKRIQAATRSKFAKRKVDGLREAQRIRDEMEIEKQKNAEAAQAAAAEAAVKESLLVTSSVASSEEAETIMEKVFELFATRVKGEMDVNEFKKLIRETNVATTKFTTLDAEIVFRKTLAKVESLGASSPLAAGVIFGKRITFPVFQQVAVPLTAQTRRCLIDDLITLFKAKLENSNSTQA